MVGQRDRLGPCHVACERKDDQADRNEQDGLHERDGDLAHAEDPVHHRDEHRVRRRDALHAG